MNWFKYRLPDSPDVFAGASGHLIDGLGQGFVFAPFDAPSAGMKTIPCDFIPDKSHITAEVSSLPVSTSKSEYVSEVESIVSALAGRGGKVVAARSIRVECDVDLDATFSSLCSNCPDAFVFMFSSSVSGTWIGASPELLLKVDGSEVRTMALAGTKPIDDDSPWDRKNIEEQSMVTSFITDCLRKYFPLVICHPTFTKMAGHVKHICTPISADQGSIDPASVTALPLNDILCDLSPTPAVCGSDRSFSMKLIGDYEHFRREMYGGFCGPNDIYGVSSFFVNLRSAKCTPSAVTVFAGGGITSLSRPEDEWLETEFKSKTILTNIQTK